MGLARFALLSGVTVLLLLAGCNSSSGTNPLDPSSYPLNPTSLSEGAKDTSTWSQELTDTMLSVSRVSSDTAIEKNDGCTSTVGSAATGATITLDACGAPNTAVDGAVTIDPIADNTSHATYDLLVTPSDTSKTPYTIKGETSLTLLNPSSPTASVHQQGDLTLKAELSKITATTDLTYLESELVQNNPYPSGTVKINYKTLGLSLLKVTVTMDGTDTFQVKANDAEYTYNATTHVLSPK